jgi:hypothetical protein
MSKFSYTPILFTKKSRVRNNTVKSIIAHINKTGEGYECIQGNCIPYYDFDSEYRTERKRADKYETDLNSAVNQIKDLYPNGNILTFTACGLDPIKKKYKNSFHFKIRGVGYYNQASEIPKLDLFDSTVYNNKHQLFRLSYCSKAGQNRFLKRFDINTGKIYELDEIPEPYEKYFVQNTEGEKLNIVEPVEVKEPEIKSSDIDVDFYINKVKANSKILDLMVYKSHKEYENKIIINFRRLCPEYCETCKRTHDKDATPYITILLKSNKIFINCIRNKQSKFVCKIDELKPCVDAVKIDKLIKIATKVNNKYCANIPVFMDSIENKTHGTIIIKSNMGTGKTYAVAKAINNRNKISPIKAGVVSFRIALAKKYADDFHGFTNYLDVRDREIDADNWICQLDSLYRIKPQELDYLILDEVSQLRKHLTAKTFMNNRNFLQNRASLQFNIRTAGQVIIMDANATQADREWVSSMRTAEELIIVNEYIKKGVKVVLNTKSQVIARIKEDYAAGRKFIVAHNGKAESHLALARQISSLSDASDILVINSITANDDDIKAALNSPNTEFGKYNGVFMSPTAQAGISYDMANVFHSIYGIFGNGSNSSGDACQMLNRVRHPISKTQYVNVRLYNFGETKPTNPKTMKDYLMSSKKHIFKKSKGAVDMDVLAIIERIPFEYNDVGEIEFTESELLNEVCINHSEHNLDSILFKKNFIEHQLSYGNTIIDDKKKDGDVERKITKETKDSVESIKIDIATEIHGSNDLTDAEASTLKKKIKDTPEKVEKTEFNSIKKYNIKKFYKMPEKKYSVGWYVQYTGATYKKYYYNQNLYINKPFADGLKQLKKREIINNVYCSVAGSSNLPEQKTTEQYIVDTLLTTSRYIKHKILIGWLEELKYNALNDIRKTNVDTMKNLLINLKNNLTENTFKKLGKHYKNLEKIKKWKITDADFLKNMLRFINGSLQSEFGISIKKFGKNSTDYCLYNEYSVCVFAVGKNTNEHDTRPILGKIEIVSDDENYKKYIGLESEEPYDSDEEYTQNG